MPKVVEVPGVGIVEFPDSMSDEQVATALKGDPTFNPPPPMSAAQQFVRQTAPSVIGGAVGAGAGGLITGLTGGTGAVTIPALTSLGAAGGEALAQFSDPVREMVGRTEPGSGAQVAVAGLLPVVPSAARRFTMALPGAAQGLQDFMLSRFGAEGEKLIGKFAPIPGAAKQLFQQAAREAKQTNLKIIPREMASAARGLADEVSQNAYATGSQRAVIEKAQEWLTKGAPSNPAYRVLARAVDFEEFRTTQQGLGVIIAGLERKEGAALGQAKKLYKAMWADMNQAATQSGAGETLGKAIDALKAEQAADLMKQFFVRGSKTKIGNLTLDPDNFIDKIRLNRDVLEEMLPKEAIDDVVNAVKPYVTTPIPGRTGRVGFEGVGFAQRAIVGGTIGAGLDSLGLGTGSSIAGGMSGVLAVEAVSLALTTPAGRLMIRTMASQGVPLDQAGAVLLQSLRQDMSSKPDQRVIAPALKGLLP